MKLFCAPGFSSLADHIAMLEAGLEFDIVKVDICTKQTEGGGLYSDINPKGYVPALMLDDGEVLTENVAILTWVADRAPILSAPGPLGRYKLIEMLSFVATEIHKRFPIYLSATEAMQAVLREDILRWFSFAADRLEPRLSVRRHFQHGGCLSVRDGAWRSGARFSFAGCSSRLHFAHRVTSVGM